MEEIKKMLQALMESQEVLVAKVDRLEKGQQKLEEGQQKLEEGQTKLEEGQQKLEEEFKKSQREFNDFRENVFERFDRLDRYTSLFDYELENLHVRVRKTEREIERLKQN